MTLYIMISTYVRHEIKRLGQKYVDRIEEHPHILATNVTKKVKTTRLKKKTISRLMYLTVELIEHMGIWSIRSSRLP